MSGISVINVTASRLSLGSGAWWVQCQGALELTEPVVTPSDDSPADVNMVCATVVATC